jgi:hypothetical protein
LFRRIDTSDPLSGGRDSKPVIKAPRYATVTQPCNGPLVAFSFLVGNILQSLTFATTTNYLLLVGCNLINFDFFSPVEGTE